VVVGRRRRSIGSQCALGRSGKTPEDVDAVLVSLVDRVTRPDAHRRTCRPYGRPAITLRRFLAGDAVAHFASADCAHQTDSARRSLAAVWCDAGDRTSRLDARGRRSRQSRRRQRPPALLPLDRFSGSDLDVALDEVRRRFGSTAVTRAVLLGREQGFTVPLLPD